MAPDNPKHQRSTASYDDILALPENIVGEILNGELHTHPRPAPKHARAASSIGMKVGSAYDHGDNGPGGWWILDEPELHLGNDIMVPDLAGWRRERLPSLPDDPWFSLIPDWACEVLSPSTAVTDRDIKMPTYAAHGLEWLWLVDPIEKTLEVYRSSQGKWSLNKQAAGDTIERIPPFESLDFDLSVLWA